MNWGSGMGDHKDICRKTTQKTGLVKAEIVRRGGYLEGPVSPPLLPLKILIMHIILILSEEALVPNLYGKQY